MWVKYINSLSEEDVVSFGFESVDAALKYATELDQLLRKTKKRGEK